MGDKKIAMVYKKEYKSEMEYLEAAISALSNAENNLHALRYLSQIISSASKISMEVVAKIALIQEKRC